MRFFYDNLIDASGTVLTASSEVATLPVSNLANEFRTRIWRTGTGSATETVTIDLGSAQDVSSIILLDHTLTAADSAIAIQANNADAWGAPAFSQALAWQAGTIYAVFDAVKNFRYWRLTFTKSAAGESRDIGRLFLGTYYQTTEDPDYDGYQESVEDYSRVQKSLGGQTYTDLLPRYAALQTKFSDIRNEQTQAFKAIAQQVGESISFFIQVFPGAGTTGDSMDITADDDVLTVDESLEQLNKLWYVKFTKATALKVSGMDNDLIWSVTLDFEEQL